MAKTKFLTLEELYDRNIIGLKLEKQKREYKTEIQGEFISKEILRQKYLKLCSSCGTPYETYKYNSYACCHRCRQNIIYRRKKGLNPLGNMEQLTKEKRIREVKERFGYL